MVDRLLEVSPPNIHGRAVVTVTIPPVSYTRDDLLVGRMAPGAKELTNRVKSYECLKED